MTDINAAIQATRLGRSVLAGRSGNRLTLSTSGFNSLAISSAAGDPTQSQLRFADAAASPALIYTGNAPLNERLAPLVNFDASDFVQSVQGILDLFETGKLNHLTGKIPLLNQSVDEVLGISQKLKNAVQDLQSKAGVSLKLATQAIVENLRTAIRGLPGTLPDGATEDLDIVFDALRRAAQNAERTDVPHPVNLAGVIVASLTPLTQAIAKVNQPGVDLFPLNAVLHSLQQVTPSLLQLPSVFASALGSGTVTSQFVSANPGSFEQSMLVRATSAPVVLRGVSLGSLKLPDGLGPLKFAPGSTINMNVNGDFKFDFGYEFATATPFLLDTSRFKTTASLATPSQTYPATIGGVSVTLGHPTDPVSMRLATTTGIVPASLAVTVNPTSHVTDIGNIAFGDVPVRLNYGGVKGKLSGTLPVYLTGVNQGNVTFDWAFPGANLPSAPTVTAPADLIPSLQALPYNFTVYTDGIRDWNDQLERLLRYDVLGEFPLVQEGLDISGGFMGRLENQFLAAVQNAIAANNGTDSSQFRQDLFDAVQSALGSLLVSNTLEVSQSGSPELRFTIHGSDVYHAGLRLGLPGLNLEIFEQGEDVEVKLDYDLQLGFGISKTEGFYFIVQRDAGDALAPQFTLTVERRVDSRQARAGSAALVARHRPGQCGWRLAEPHADRHTELNVRLLDPDNHVTADQLDPATFPLEFQTLFGAGGATAHVDLHLVTNVFDPVQGDPSLPGIVIDLRIDQHFAAGRARRLRAIPQVRLDNIGFGLGSTLSKIVKPIVDQVNSFLGPVKPVVLAWIEKFPCCRSCRGSPAMDRSRGSRPWRLFRTLGLGGDRGGHAQAGRSGPGFVHLVEPRHAISRCLDGSDFRRLPLFPDARSALWDCQSARPEHRRDVYSSPRIHVHR